MIYDSLEAKQKPLNLAKIARWFGSQPDSVRHALEKAEPFTWLKHLDRRSTRSGRSRWNLSALVMTQYLLPNNHDRMQTIPEDSTIAESITSITRKSRSPSFLSSQGASGLGLGSSLSTGLADDRVSFEPLADTKRNSLDVVSRKSADSAFSSIRSGSSKGAVIPVSPISTRSDNKGPGKYIPSERPRSPGSSSSESLSSSDFEKSKEQRLGSGHLLVPDLSVLPPSSERLVDQNAVPVTHTSSHGSSSSSQQNKFNPSLANQSVTSLKDSSKPSNARVPLHPADRDARRHKKQRENREAQLRREYEAKAAYVFLYSWC